MTRDYIKVNIGDYVELSDGNIRQVLEVIEDEFHTIFILDHFDLCSFSDILRVSSSKDDLENE